MDKQITYKIYYPELKELYDIFYWFSETTFTSMEMMIEKDGVYILSCETMMSVTKTLENIDFCCRRGTYSDAYLLIRKVRDDLMQYIFLQNVIKNKNNNEEDIFCQQPEFMSEIMKEAAPLSESGKEDKDAIQAVKGWIDNSLEEDYNSKLKRKFFDTSKYKSYLLRNNKKTQYILETYFTDKWNIEDRVLNNYVHANGKKYISDNYKYHDNKGEKDIAVIGTIQDIADLFLSLLAVIDSTKFRSSDYSDALGMGVEPIENSQYWVCPIILEYVYKRLDKSLIAYICNNDEYGMEF